MRIRAAKRLSAHLAQVRKIPFDYFLFVQQYNPEITFNKKTYKAVISSGNAKLVRKHTCAFGLIKLLAVLLGTFDLGFFQRQRVTWFKMSSPLSLQVKDQLIQWGYDIRPLSGFRYSRPAPLSRLPLSLKEIEDDISYVKTLLPEETLAIVDEYHHSSEETEPELMVPAFTVLASKEPKTFDEEAWFDMLIRMALETDIGEDLENRIHVPKISIGALADQEQTSSASGLLPLVGIVGPVQGSKTDMANAAVQVNAQDMTGNHVPALLPYKPSMKSEVIKKNKKVRGIMLESQANYQVLKFCFETVVSSWKDPSRCSAIGISSKKGDFKQILFKWWSVVYPHTNYNWPQFLDWLAQQPAHESDKSSWEASVNETDGFAFICWLMATHELPQDRSSKRLIVRALADYINPHVQVDADGAYNVPWRVPSGSYLTSYGNTRRHRLMGDWVSDFFEMHGSAGSMTCPCDVCVYLRKAGIKGVGEPVTPMQLDLLRAAFYMGDDYISINYHAYVYDAVIDYKFGTTTKTQVKKFFSEPGLHEPEGAEFLRRHFVRVGNEVYTFRAPGRLLAKLFHGGNRHDAAKWYAALACALWDVGYNQDLFNLLYHLIHCAKNIDPVKKRDALQAYVGKYPLIADMIDEIPGFYDLVNLDSGLGLPLYRVKIGEMLGHKYISESHYAAQ